MWKKLAIQAHETAVSVAEQLRREHESKRRKELIRDATGHMVGIGLTPAEMESAEWGTNSDYGIYFRLDGVGFLFRPRNWHSGSSEADYVSLVSDTCRVCGAQMVSQFQLYRYATLADLGALLADPPKLPELHEAWGENDGVMCNGEMKLYPEDERGLE